MRSTTTYYLFGGLLNFGIGATTTAYVPFLLSIGLTLGEVALVNAVFFTVVVLAELPTGMFADGRSRAWSLKLGAACWVLGSIAYLRADGLLGAMFAESILACGSAFLSGVQKAWIVDALAREGHEADLKRIYANEALVNAAVVLLGAAAGALIALASLRLIWVPTALFSCLAGFLAAGRMTGRGEPLTRITESAALRKSLRLLASQRDLKWLAAGLFVFGLVVSFNHYWTPYFKPQVGQLGLWGVWVAIYLSLTVSAWSVRRFGIRIGSESGQIVGALVLSGGGLILLALSGGLALPVAGVVVHEFGRGLFQPTTDAFTQKRVESSHRATFGSLQSLIGRAGFAAVPAVVWLCLLDRPDTTATIVGVWLACGLGILASSGILWALRPR